MRASFQRKEIVWGKIESYPWWPGKIISMHIQSDEIVYKILFFADPTYAYLSQSQLLPFKGFDRNVNACFPKNTQLSKAIRMADHSYAKGKMAGRIEIDELEIVCKAEPTVSMKNQSSCNIKQSQQIIPSNQVHGIEKLVEEEQQEREVNKELLDRIKSQETMVNFSSERQNFEKPKVKQETEAITIDNVINFLQRRMNSQSNTSEISKHSQKSKIRANRELRQKLLERYNLHKLCKISFAQTQIDTNIQQQNIAKLLNHRKRKHILKRLNRRKTKNEKDVWQLKDKCLRKLYNFAKKSLRSKVDSYRLKIIASNSIKKLGQLSQNQPNLFKSMFINLIRFIQRLSLCQIDQIDDMTNNFNGYFDRIENDKNQQEEGSKMTQVSVPSF